LTGHTSLTHRISLGTGRTVLIDDLYEGLLGEIVAEQSSAHAGPPDPGRIANQQDFGRELTRLRNRAGKTIRQVAAEAHIPPSTAGDYFSGSHLPQASARSLLQRILAACGESDPEVIGQWMDALTRARRAPGKRPAGEPPPYLGTASFQVEDAQWFFGRDDVTRLIMDLAADRSGEAGGGADYAGARGGSRGTDAADMKGKTTDVAGNVPLVVVGPSGAGKSSLLRAGLVPALRARGRHRTGTGGPRLLIFNPGAHPLLALAAQLVPANAEAAEAKLRADPRRCTDLAGKIRPPGLAVIVDQFEEIFTDRQDEGEIQAFIAALCALPSPALVVLGLRADFYARALTYPNLAAALRARQIVVGPMSEAQLRQAITEPARLAKLNVQDGLVELLLRDLAQPARSGAAGAPYEPGALALLSRALLAVWKRCRGGLLTVAAYEASGGIRDAMARTAETAFGTLTADQRRQARRLFLLLVQITDGAVVRRRLPIDVVKDGTDADVLATFIAQRLITVDAYAAEITHEALLGAWPRLRAWIDADREWLRMRRRISEAARAWRDGGREVTDLLRGRPLAIARDSAAQQPARVGLSHLEQEFLDAGIANERAERYIEKRRTRRLRRLVATLGVAVLATVTLVGYATAQHQAVSVAQAAANSREVAAEARQVRGDDVSVAAQLSLAAYRISHTAEALSSLLDASGTPAAARLLDSTGVVKSVAVSPDHQVLAVATDDGSLHLWDVARPGRPFSFGPPIARLRSALYAAAFGLGGQLLAAAGADHRIRFWDTADPRRPSLAGPPLSGPAGIVYCLAFSHDGRVLAAGSADDSVRLWDTADPRHPRPLATLTGPAVVESVAFSPDGTTIAAGSADGRVRLWRLAGSADGRVRLWRLAGAGRPVALGRPLTAQAGIVDAVTFSPDGRKLAVSGGDSEVWLWDLTDPARPVRARTPLTGATDGVSALGFSPDGQVLVAGSGDDTALGWSVLTGAVIFRLPHPAPVTSLAWVSARDLVTGAADGTVRLWAVPPPVLDAGGSVHSVSFSPDGHTLAIGTADLALWDTATHTQIATAAAGTLVNAVAFGPDGGVLAAGYGNGSIQLWRAGGPGAPVPLGPPLRASAGGPVEFVSFRRDGNALATAGNDGTVRLWNVSDPANPRPLALIAAAGSRVFSAVISPNGRVLATASADKTVRLWNVADPSKPVPFAPPLTGPRSYVHSVAFSPDGRVLAVGGADKTIRLWNIADPSRPTSLGTPLTSLGGFVYSLVFSPDGQTLAAGVTDGTVSLWDTSANSTPVMRADLTGPAGQVYSVAFSPGGRLIAAGSADHTVRLWDTGSEAAAAAVCATAGDPLTRAEWSMYIPGAAYAPPCRPAHAPARPTSKPGSQAPDRNARARAAASAVAGRHRQ
jgi:WD40 repeat protein